MTKKGIYRFTLIGVMAGYAWLTFSIFSLHTYNSGQGIWGGCLFKQLLHIPCPACGSTRSILVLIGGHPVTALQYNPFGYLLLAALLILPCWLAYDKWSGKSTYYQAYIQAERILRKPPVFFLFWLLVLANWIWKFFKYSH